MYLGIDASNIRAGGGVTHLVELLKAAKPDVHGFDKVFLWSGTPTLDQIEPRPWLEKVHDPQLDSSLLVRGHWQRFMLDRLVRQANCGLLFVPGGIYHGYFYPYVTMSRNLLPFQSKEAQRYGLFSKMFLKMKALNWSQTRTMRQADGVIFLTEYARNVVMPALGNLRGATTVIPHGVNRTFDCPPRPQKALAYYSTENPFRILYVSIITVYKHQWHVAQAVAQLRNAGFPIQLDLVGSAYAPALKRLQQTLSVLDPEGDFIRYRGPVSYVELHHEYQQADAFVFASSCETFGQIVTEAMSAGLPIICSNTGTMRELLGEAAVYFYPEQPDDIAQAVRLTIENVAQRQKMAEMAYERSHFFSWEKCAYDTFAFLAKISRSYKQ